MTAAAVGTGAPARATKPDDQRPFLAGGPLRWLLAALELGFIFALYSLYSAGREMIHDQIPTALRNAEWVHTFEGIVRLPSEAWLQDVAGHVPQLLHAANYYYYWAHFPVTVGFLVVGFLVRPRVEYLWARNLMVTQTVLALGIHFFAPLAPPRMFPQWGFLDTMRVYGPNAYEGASAAVANQYAAMPSLHMGWAVLIAVVVWRTASRRWGVLAVLHAVTTVLVVIVTANHWWLDGIVAVGLLGLALVLFPGPGRYRFPLPWQRERTTADAHA